MPPADQDGKKSAPLGNAAAAAPAESASDFDWGQAIDEWDPTFFSDSLDASPDPTLGFVVQGEPGAAAAKTATSPTATPPAAATTEPVASVPATAEPTPAQVAAQVAAPAQAQAPVEPAPQQQALSAARDAAAVSSGPAPLPAPPAVEPEVPSLPPPPAAPPPVLDIEIDLSRAPARKSQLEKLERVETTLAMDAREVDRLAAMLRSEDFAGLGAMAQSARPSATPAPAPTVAAPVKPSSVEEEDFYDNIVVESTTGAQSKISPAPQQPLATSDSNKTPEVAPTAAALDAARPSYDPPEPSSKPAVAPMTPRQAVSAPASSADDEDDDDDLAIQVEIGTTPEPTPAAPETAPAPVAASPAAAPEPVLAPAATAATPEPAPSLPMATAAAVAVVAAAPAVPTPEPEPTPAPPVVTPAAQFVVTPAAPPVATTPTPASLAPPPVAEAPSAEPTPAVRTAVRAAAVEPPQSVAVPAQAPSRPAQAITPRRLALPALDKLPMPTLARPSAAGAPEASLRRQFQNILDAERERLGDRDPQRRSRLGLAAARQSEALRETADAMERYRGAQEADTSLKAALRGSRRVLSWAGPTSQPDEATTFLDREVERSSPAEAQGLSLVRAELQRVQGQLIDASVGFAGVAKDAAANPAVAASQSASMLALLGQCDVALAKDADGETAAALDALLQQPNLAAPLRTALHIARARHDEKAGRDTQASSRYEAVLEQSAGACLSASLGLIRLAGKAGAASTKASTASAPAIFETLLRGRLPRGLRQALARQMALLSTGAERAAKLTQCAEPGDWLVAEDLALSHEENGDFESAAAAFRKLAEVVRDPLQRSLALSSAGEAAFRAGLLDEARPALLESLRQAAAADIDVDVFALRLLERICFQQGRMDDLLALYGATSGLPRERAAYVQSLAAQARLRRGSQEGGAPSAEQKAQAIAELQRAVQLYPDNAPALLLLVEQLLADGQLVEAARLLLAAANHRDDDVPSAQRRLQASYREEAARLLAMAGRTNEAAAALLQQADSVSSLPAATRWRLAALAPLLQGDAALADAVANVLAVEAEHTSQRSRVPVLWHARGTLLAEHHPTVQTSLGPVEDSFRRALLAEPGYAPALNALHLRALATPPEQLAHSPLIHVVLDGLRTRMERASGRPEALLWALRLGAAQEFEARDAASALLTYKHLRQLAPDHAALVGLEDTLFVTAWRAGHAFDSLEHELHVEQDPDRRYALLLLSGEQLELQGHPARAAERFAQALECRPGHPVAKAYLVRAYQAAGQLSELDTFTARELKEATDVNTRVGAYERQARLATQRGDSEGVITAYRNVLTFDTNNHAAMRALERHFIASQQWGELVQLYEQMGLTATDTAYGVHTCLDRARLRERLVRQGKGDASTLANELENDFRLALYRDRHCLPALRSLLAAAQEGHDSLQIAALSKNVAEIFTSPGDLPGYEHGDVRSAAVFWVHSAEAAIQAARPTGEVIAAYRAALKLVPDLVPALRGLLHFAIGHQEFATVADVAEALAACLHDSGERYLHHMLAGVVSQELLKDIARARRAFAAGMRLLPDRDEAFERLRVSYNSQAMSPETAKALGDLLTERLQNSNEPLAQKSNLRLELAQLFLGPLGDRARARRELEQAVADTPDHPAALYTLGKMLTDEKEWARAAELLERYCNSEQRPSQLVALHLLLADMYQDHLADAGKAIIHYTRVLQLQPQNILALGKVADLFLAQQKLQGALPILRRLVKYADDKNKRIAYYHRIAALCEQEKDTRGALEALRQAVECDPMHLPAIGELAKFYNRQSDVASMRIHLDRAAARFRPILRERPRDAAALQALLQIFIWRGQTDSARVTASVLQALGHSLPPEVQAQVDKLPPRRDPSKAGMADSSVDDVLFPSRVAPGFRALFRLVAEPLAKLYASDGKKLASLGVDRRERLPRAGHPLRDLANKLAAQLGIEEFDLYLTAAQRTDEDGKKSPLCTLEPLEHPTIILSTSLVQGTSEAEQRFLLGGLLKLVQSQLLLPLSLSAYDLGLVIGALVRLYVPSYTPIGYAEKQIANEAARIKRAIPSKLQGQLLPHAMECSSAALDFEGITELIILASHHAGLVLTGDIGSALSMLRRKGSGSERLVDDMLRFAVSEEFSELRRIITA